jgi:hypothetical protein
VYKGYEVKCRERETNLLNRHLTDSSGHEMPGQFVSFISPLPFHKEPGLDYNVAPILSIERASQKCLEGITAVS